jgi:hypothetical protein
MRWYDHDRMGDFERELNKIPNFWSYHGGSLDPQPLSELVKLNIIPARFVASPISQTVKKASEMPSALPVL